MKIKRRKKNDRTAFWHMSYNAYGKFRLSTNLERRTDRMMAPQSLIARDRDRAAHFRKRFKEGTPVRLFDLLPSPCPNCGGPMVLVHQNAVIDALMVPGCRRCGYQILTEPDHKGCLHDSQ